MRFSLLKNSLFIGIGVVLLSCSSSKEKVFENEAKEQNRLCPMMIDSYTRVDSVAYTAPDNTFRYYYTLVGEADDIAIAAQKREALSKQLPIEIKNAQGLTIHRNHKVTMEYIYLSESSSKELLHIVITPEMYLE